MTKWQPGGWAWMYVYVSKSGIGQLCFLAWQKIRARAVFCKLSVYLSVSASQNCLDYLQWTMPAGLQENTPLIPSLPLRATLTHNDVLGDLMYALPNKDYTKRSIRNVIRKRELKKVHRGPPKPKVTKKSSVLDSVRQEVNSKSTPFLSPPASIPAVIVLRGLDLQPSPNYEFCLTSVVDQVPPRGKHFSHLEKPRDWHWHITTLVVGDVAAYW